MLGCHWGNVRGGISRYFGYSRYFEVLQGVMGIRGISRYFKAFRGISRYSKVLGSIGKYFKVFEVFRGISKYFKVFRGISRYFKVFGGISTSGWSDVYPPFSCLTFELHWFKPGTSSYPPPTPAPHYSCSTHPPHPKDAHLRRGYS
jgi:hypothetical protein